MRSIVHHLSLIPEVGPVTIKQLGTYIAQGRCTWQDLYHYRVEDFMQAGITPRIAALLCTGLADRRILEQEQELITRHHLVTIAITDADYPPLLKAIHAPPPLLYVQGVAGTLLHSSIVALVGSRDANAYGLEATAHLVSEIIPAGWITISGGARGIDAAVHQKSLHAGGKTIAVLGSGLLRPYPHEHRKLFHSIVEHGGAVISSYPLETTAAPGNFPARNRIIAGIARACVVVQAAEKSGALITALYALNEGREVGVVPGSIFDPRSAGCHALLQQGATPITSGRALLTLLGDHRDDIQNTTASPISPQRDNASSNMTDPLLQACITGATFDDLLAVTSEAPETLHTLLWDLQIQGTIEQDIQGKWRTKGKYL